MNVDVVSLVPNSLLTSSSDQGTGTLASDGRLQNPVLSWQQE